MQRMQQFIKYGLSGGVTFGLEYLTFLIAHFGFDLSVLIANTLSFIAALLASFSLNRMWVFKRSGTIQRQFGLFTILAATNYAITTLVLIVSTGAGISPAITKLAMMLVVAIWNFIILRKVIFK